MPIRARISALLLATLAALAALPALAQGTLTIGITQFPSNFHPNIDSMMAKSYVLAMTQRPFTTYDPEWELICMLCETLPSFENGLAEREPLEPGTGPEGITEGIAATYTIREGATWGDGTPVTTRDVLFTYEVGRHPQSGISNAEM
ncbi:MAG: peptide ABC transporter substrate-binding protein, partial [Geminicoccales bacterium]